MKSWFQSKTVWFNIIMGVVTILAFPQFISVIPVSWLPYVALVTAIGNWVLRVYFTSTPIGTPPAA